MTNDGAKHKNNANVLLSTRTMQMSWQIRLLSTNTMANELVSTRTMVNDVARTMQMRC